MPPHDARSTFFSPGLQKSRAAAEVTTLTKRCFPHVASTRIPVKAPPNLPNSSNHVSFPAGTRQLFKPSGSLPTFPQQLSPSIPAQLQAARQLGYGAVTKVVMEFRQVWNKWEKKTGFILSDAEGPTWWTQSPDSPLLIFQGWHLVPLCISLAGDRGCKRCGIKPVLSASDLSRTRRR